MPTMVITSNVPLNEDKQKEIVEKGAAILADCIGKPKAFTMALYESTTMVFGGSFDPCAFVRVISIGGLNKEVNTKISAQVAELLQEYCDVTTSRYYIEFVSSEREFFGFKGATFSS